MWGRWHFNARAIVTAMAMRGKPEAGRLFSRREKLPNGGASVFWVPMAPAWEPLSLGDFPILRLGFNVLCSRVETTSGLFPTWKIEKVFSTVCVCVCVFRGASENPPWLMWRLMACRLAGPFGPILVYFWNTWLFMAYFMALELLRLTSPADGETRGRLNSPWVSTLTHE